MRTSEERKVTSFDHFFQVSSDLMAIAGNDGRLLRANAAFHEALKPDKEIHAVHIGELVPPADTEEFNRKWKAAVDEGCSFTTTAPHSHGCGTVPGERICWRFTPNRDERIVYAVGRIEKDPVGTASAQGSDEWYRSCLDRLVDGFCIYSSVRNERGEIMDFRIDYVNHAACASIGLAKEELIGNSFLRVFPGTKDNLWERLVDAVETEEVLHVEDFEYTDQRVRGVYDLQFYKFGDGFAVCWRDVSHRKKTEERLAGLIKKFSVAFHNAPTINFIAAAEDGRIIDANRHFLHLAFGDCPVEKEKPVQELDMWCLPEGLTELMREAGRSGTVHNREIPFRTINGNLRTGLLSGEKVVIDYEDCILFIMKDITDLKETERQLILMDKYHLLGSMAASIAHEVRNPMTTVKGYLQLFMKGGELLKYRSRFELMLNELERANSIISEYLSLANNRPMDKEFRNLNEIIAYMRPLLEADALKNQVELSVRAGRIDSLYVNEKEIRQLLLNLCRNAIEAMSEGGTLFIRTFMEGPYVMLEVADQGQGIESRLLDDIFKPFFTTKEKGTGLGLAVSRSIAERHNGTIRVKTGSGGTTFFIAFDTRSCQVTKLIHSS